MKIKRKVSFVCVIKVCRCGQIAEKCHTIVARIRKKYVSVAISSQNGRPRRKKKVNQLFQTKILNYENNSLTPTKNGRPKIGKELYGVTKQKLIDSNPTNGPGIRLHPRIMINQVI